MYSFLATLTKLNLQISTKYPKQYTLIQITSLNLYLHIILHKCTKKFSFLNFFSLRALRSCRCKFNDWAVEVPLKLLC